MILNLQPVTSLRMPTARAENKYIVKHNYNLIYYLFLCVFTVLLQMLWFSNYKSLRLCSKLFLDL